MNIISFKKMPFLLSVNYFYFHLGLDVLNEIKSATSHAVTADTYQDRERETDIIHPNLCWSSTYACWRLKHFGPVDIDDQINATYSAVIRICPS